SVELIKKDVILSNAARYVIVASWIVLALSIIAGTLSYLRIPVMLSKGEYNLTDKYMEVPGRLQQLLFVMGVIILGIALAILLFIRPVNASETKQTNTEAKP